MSTSKKPVTIDFMDLDFSKLSFSKKKETKYMSHYVNITYNDAPVYVIFPRSPAPFGLSRFVDKKDGSVSYSLPTSFEDKNPASNLKAFYDKAVEFDNFMIKKGIKNHREWLGEAEKPDEKFVRKMYSPLVSYSKDKETKLPKTEYSGRSSAKFFCNKNGEFDFDFYNAKKERVQLTDLNYTEHVRNGDEISSVRIPQKVWLSNVGFGVTWKLVQARGFPNSSSLPCVLGDDDDDVSVDGSASDTNSQKSFASAERKTRSSAAVDPGDDDTDYSEEEEIKPRSK